MKIWIQLALVAIGLFILFWALSAAVGMLFWVGIIVAIAAVVAAIIGSLFRSDNENPSPNLRDHRRADKKAERALKELERKNKQ